MEPEQFQLGFLKVLKGSYMHDMVEEYGLKYRGKAPYEVLSTKWLPYSDVLRLKGVEDIGGGVLQQPPVSKNLKAV